MHSAVEQDIELMTIGELSRLCGVNTVTLRAWERRHGLLKPERNAKGHRYYRAHHVNEVSEILKWLERGYAISKIKPFLNRETTEWTANDVWLACRQRCYQAVSETDERQLDLILSDLLALYPVSLFAEKVLLPCLDQWVVDYRSRLMAEPVFHFGLNALRTRFHYRLTQINRSQRSASDRSVVFVSLSESRYDGHFYLLANVLADLHLQVMPLHASGGAESLPHLLSSCCDSRLLLFANSALSSGQVSALQRAIHELALPTAMFGGALQVQRDTLSRLPVTLLSSNGSKALDEWVNAFGERA